MLIKITTRRRRTEPRRRITFRTVSQIIVVESPLLLSLQMNAPPFQGGIPVIFYGVIGAAVEQPRNGGPPVAVPVVRRRNGVVLRLGEGAVLDLRAELVAPPQPARFPRPALDVLTDQRPVPGAVPVHQPGQDLVFLRTPRAFNSLRQQHIRIIRRSSSTFASGQRR
ncbi:hypothetical protein ABFX02_14G256400 [Erythranthe guttata]